MSARYSRQAKAREEAYQRHARYLRYLLRGRPQARPSMGEEGDETIWNYSFGYDLPHRLGMSREEIDRIRFAEVRRRTRALRHARTR